MEDHALTDSYTRHGFILVQGDVLTRIGQDCSKSQVRLDETQESLQNQLEDERRSFEKGNLVLVHQDVQVMRAIYNGGLIKSKVQLGPSISESRFQHKNLDVHQTGHDFAFVNKVDNNQVRSRTFLLHDVLIRVYKTGEIYMNPIKCLEQYEQTEITDLQRELENSAKNFHDCQDKHLKKMAEVANAYHATVDKIKALLDDGSERSEQETLSLNQQISEAEASYKSNRDELNKERDNCINKGE